jgi:hypothetical protein
MASPDDFMGGSRGPLPASYSPNPNIGFQIGDRLAGLPAQYEAGQKMAMATALRNAFPNGLPTRPDGSIDALSITNKIASIGGLDQSSIGPLMNLAARQSLAVGDAPPGTAAAAPVGAVPAAAPIARSAPMASNAESGDVDTIRGIATEVFGGREVSQYIPRYAAALKVGEDTPLTPEQQQTARRIMGKSAAYLRSQPTQTDENGAAGAPVSGGASGSPAPVGGTSGAAGVAGGTPGGPPVTARATPFMPAPKQPVAEPAAGGGQRMAQTSAGANAPVGQNLVPAGVQMTPLQYGSWLMQRAHAHANAGDNEGAKLFQQQAQPNFDALKQAGEIPNEVKVAGSQGMTPLQFEAAKTQQGKDIDVYTKLNTGIQSMANTGVAMLPTLQAADSLLGAGAATGWGSDKILTAKQILARFGGDPNGAVTLEAFGKQMAAFINQQTNTLKSEAVEIGGTGRIFSQMVDNMQKASPSPDYTPSGNRYLVEVYRRGIQRSVELADMANRYKNQNGRLDGNFEAQARTYQINNPMFTPEEVKDPRRVAPPVVNSVADLRAIGWHDGEPFRSAVSGKIFTHVPKGM